MLYSMLCYERSRHLRTLVNHLNGFTYAAMLAFAASGLNLPFLRALSGSPLPAALCDAGLLQVKNKNLKLLRFFKKTKLSYSYLLEKE